MLVVADTSPINNLILIEEIDILAKMYDKVAIPPAVRDELLRRSAPEMVRSWMDQLPSWLDVRVPVNEPDALLAKLDPGERDAILLAGELRAGQLIVDDREGRREAEKRGIAVMGTLGVLQEAATLRLLDLRLAVKRLQRTSFYLAPEVMARLLKDQP
jgi:predicted nucleic acid-binding protein